MTSIIARAQAALDARNAELEAEAAARRADAEADAARQADAEARRLMAATATLRTAAADAFASLLGGESTADDWAPLGGTTSCAVHEVDGLQFGVWWLLVGGVERLQLGARIARTDVPFRIVPSLEALGALVDTVPPATAGPNSKEIHTS